ncbi:MAG TPA: hypothetical protein PLH70_08980 [Bacteroidales bacterium]|nr:hypothetical protein [Bacteroidales bacterium]HOH23346.1 hypothetical protein [Bacteroidales bacterium]HPZ04064.1 hypothetical protein [Bacteroidales bacterium]HQB75918.1 hypothetical protein [Bacteroidales bacterium]
MKEGGSQRKISGKKAILFLFLGVFIGILFSAVFVWRYQDRLFKKDTDRIFVVVNSEREEPEQVEKVKPKLPPGNFNSQKESQDTTEIEMEYEDEIQDSFEDAEFFIDEPIDGDMILEEKLLQSKMVRVIAKNRNLEDLQSVPEAMFKNFEVEKWNSPIVNRISYQRDNSLLKLKGVDIQNLSIFYVEGEYYLQIGAQLFAIPETHTYQRLYPFNIHDL